MTHRLTILHKGLILIAVPLLFQLAFIGLVARMRTIAASAMSWTIHTKEVIAQADHCRVSLLSDLGAFKGLSMTHDPSLNARLRFTVAKTPHEIAYLRALVSDNPNQLPLITNLESLINRFTGHLSVGVSRIEAGTMDAAMGAIHEVESRTILDEIDREFERFLSVERGLDARRQTALDDTRAVLDRIINGGIIVSILFTLFLAILFARNISGRIDVLAENARRLATGQALRAPIVGGDEVAGLDQVFHQMAEVLNQAKVRELEHARLLESRAEELDLINSQLREKAQENEMFVYSVSHDLRSPLVNLQGFSKELQLIGKDLTKILDREEVPLEVRREARKLIGVDMGESIGFIQSGVTRLSAIIDALLRLSRAGQVEYRQAQVEVAPIVHRVVTALRGTLDERKAEVEVGELPPAWGDSTAIEQVFANLIGNAVNYLDPKRPGKIVVRSCLASELTSVPEKFSPGSMIYLVADNGLGIADSYKSKIFTAFQRLHGDVAKGEGVGLALVRRMVERHGGTVWFESTSGQGTTFFVAFPGVEAMRSKSDRDFASQS